jgi:hypothetical protein
MCRYKILKQHTVQGRDVVHSKNFMKHKYTLTLNRYALCPQSRWYIFVIYRFKTKIGVRGQSILIFSHKSLARIMVLSFLA